MKAILVFDLEDHSDNEKFRVASRALEWYLVCLNLDNDLRDMLKHRGAGKAIEEVRSKFHQLMEEYGVSLDDMS